MNSHVQLAQAGQTSSDASQKKPIVKKVFKPQDGQAITVELGYDQQAKLDLTAVTNEKMTLVHVGENLIILFDNNSTVTVHPFFDSTGAPLQALSVEVAPGRDLPSGEFASVFPITPDPSVLAAGEQGVQQLASGANFSPVAVDELTLPTPLPLLGPEELPNFTITFETIPVHEQEQQQQPSEPPTHGVVTATDTGALVNEAGLPTGSDAASNSEIFKGSITPSGGTGPYTYTLNGSATGSHGTLVLNAADGTYTYTLTSPFDTTPDSATTAAQTEQGKDSFSYTVTDAHGNSTTGTILVDIIDDVPTAHVDTAT